MLIFIWIHSLKQQPKKSKMQWDLPEKVVGKCVGLSNRQCGLVVGGFKYQIKEGKNEGEIL